MTVSQNSDLIIRVPQAKETARVLNLFRGTSFPSQAQLLVATKLRPVERILGGIAGWTEAEFGRFQLACLPGTAREEVACQLIEQAVETARQAGIQKLLYAELLTEDNPQSVLLKANQFDVFRTERCFHLDTQVAGSRVFELVEKYGRFIPQSWRIEPIQHHPPESVLELIAPYRLMTPEEVRRKWPGSPNPEFDPEVSLILFDDQKAIGTVLLRRKGNRVCYDVRVVQHPNRRLRSLANLCLFKFHVEWNRRTTPVRWIEFRGGEFEHRETANLAARMGGIELPPRHVLGRDLSRN